jgi:hypothetical protein
MGRLRGAGPGLHERDARRFAAQVTAVGAPVAVAVAAALGRLLRWRPAP